MGFHDADNEHAIVPATRQLIALEILNINRPVRAADLDNTIQNRSDPVRVLAIPVPELPTRRISIPYRYYSSDLFVPLHGPGSGIAIAVLRELAAWHV